MIIIYLLHLGSQLNETLQLSDGFEELEIADEVESQYEFDLDNANGFLRHLASSGEYSDRSIIEIRSSVASVSAQHRSIVSTSCSWHI